MMAAVASQQRRRRGVLDQRGGNVALDLFVLGQHLGRFLDQAFAGSGLTPSEFAVYAQLARRPMTPMQVRDVLGLRPPTLSGYLASMDKRGHLERTPNAQDGRSTWLELSAEGRDQWTTGRLRMRSAVRALNAQLGGTASVETARAGLADIDDALLAAVEQAAARA